MHKEYINLRFNLTITSQNIIQAILVFILYNYVKINSFYIYFYRNTLKHRLLFYKNIFLLFDFFDFDLIFFIIFD